MALETTTQIFIAGTPISSYKSIKLNQEISSHHDLTLVCRADVVEGLSDQLIGDSKDHLGETITIRIAPTLEVGSYRELEFKGIIIKVEGAKGSEYGKSDMVIFHAKSTSILADDGAHYASFTDVGLAEILEYTFSEYDRGKLETRFSPTSSDTIHYAVQHNQSSFDFASRLAAYYNQWFYYDGSKLVFGTPSDEETELSYGIDLQNFSVELSSVPNTFKYFTNDYLTDELHQKSSNEVTIPSEGYHGFTNQKSQEVFAKQTQVYHNLYTDENVQARLDQQAEAYTKAKALKQVVAKGESDNPGVNLGEVITIQGYGRYRVTKVSHTNTEGGIYKNTFEAVAADFTVYPNMDINRFPKSEIQIATVVENNDPDGLSRIKVQFPWQRMSGQTTPWLRMMTPHAGTDKGFHFIPELGEEVVVNFEGGNAERPFVAGTLYHGLAQASSWQSDSNDIKAIRSRSGHTVTLNDTQGGEMIVISDKNSNLIQFDTVTSSIMISAPENLILQSKNMEIRATENLKIATGKNKVEQITGDYKLTASNIYEAASKDMKSQGEKITRQSVADMNVSSTGGNVNKQADQKVNNNSGEQGNVF